MPEENQLIQIVQEMHVRLREMDTRQREVAERVSRLDGKIDQLMSKDESHETRLNKHSIEIDDVRDRIVRMETRQEHEDKTRTWNYAKISIVATVVATVLSIVLVKFIN